MQLWLVRHGETEWSRDLKHTGRTDVPLTPAGEGQAKTLATRLTGHEFARVLSSPRLRARQTAELAGFGKPEIVDDLAEFDYGEYEGLTTKEIRTDRPGWDLWRDGCPGGETTEAVGRRMDAVLDLIGEPEGDVLLFAHGHCLRILAARYLSLRAESASLFGLDPGTLSILGHERERRVMRSWNAPA
ncbi:MAG: histidine phosphatase family protein [Actinomycetota bacterium]